MTTSACKVRFCYKFPLLRFYRTIISVSDSYTSTTRPLWPILPFLHRTIASACWLPFFDWTRRHCGILVRTGSTRRPSTRVIRQFYPFSHLEGAVWRVHTHCWFSFTSQTSLSISQLSQTVIWVHSRPNKTVENLLSSSYLWFYHYRVPQVLYRAIRGLNWNLQVILSILPGSKPYNIITIY